MTEELCPDRVVTSSCEQTLHSFIVLSWLPEAKYLPSAVNATEVTLPLCPYSVAISFCDSTMYILALLSQLPEAKYLPSGENAIEVSCLLCPTKSGNLSYFRFFRVDYTKIQESKRASVTMQLFIYVFVKLPDMFIIQHISYDFLIFYISTQIITKSFYILYLMLFNR